MKISTGTIIELGEHRLICGDSSDATLIQSLIGDKKISLILTDPPYGVDYVNSKSGFVQDIGKPKTITGDQLQTNEQYRHFSSSWLNGVKPFLRKKNSMYIFNSDKMLFALKDALDDAGFKFAQLLIWVKTSAVVGRLDYLPQHELIAYGWHGTHAFCKSKDKSVLVHPKPSKSKLHPTMKPVGLLRRLILNSTDVHQVVYDPFGGSGSTLIACEQTGRTCFMMEIDPEYCVTIIKRWEQLTNKKARIC